ncbi:MAG: carboxypeptidase regulatory-like domain-containing protein [Candidatus Acidiferrales bacterium]
MNEIWRAALVTIVFGALLVASVAQAGDVKGKVFAEGLKSPGNIAVYVDAIPGKKFDPPEQHVAVDQRNLVFIPHTIVILRGTNVDFLNSDQVAHNVFWPSINGDRKLHHSLAIISPGQKNSFQFNDVGTAQLLCNLHVKMVGYVVVVPTPYFALTDSDGSFTIKNIPAGTYTLKTWSEDGKPTTQTITVTDATTSVDITVKK